MSDVHDHRNAGGGATDISSPSDQAGPQGGVMERSDHALSIAPAPVADAGVLDPEDSDQIGGFVWKFPSEGTNATSSESNDAVAYPRKCRYCQRAWVSSFVHERRHWKDCVVSETVTSEPNASASLGIARRVWCEVDSALTSLQWRDDIDSKQDHAACRIAFTDMKEVALLKDPRDCFQITTALGRRIVFQCRRQEPDELAPARALDAAQWTEYLQMFSRFTQAKDDGLETIAEETEVLSPQGDPQDELRREIQRVIDANDADALEEILSAQDLFAATSLTDATISSLLVQAMQRQADARIVRVMLRAGIDCNAKNEAGESPLLLAAASGDLEILQLLLRAPSIRVNQRGALGATAFHAAANAGDVDALRALCDHDDVNTISVDENGWTALHYAAACKTGRSAMAFLCELLPELVDAQCIQGNTALHVAAGCGCEQNLRVLLETAANPHVLNTDGHSAYHVALHNHHVSCAMAVHEYMESTPRDAYDRIASSVKEDRIAPSETTTYAYDYHQYTVGGEYDSFAASAWAEYVTDDQIPYFYNAVTGESTWHTPDALKQPMNAPPPPPPTSPPLDHQFSWSPDELEVPERDDDHGHILPLCMIPLVSPLVSLDDPTAATKLNSRRKKDRERRRSKMHRHRSHSSSHVSTHALPPPPPEYSLAHGRRASHHDIL